MKFWQTALLLLDPYFLFGCNILDGSNTDCDKEGLLIHKRWHKGKEAEEELGKLIQWHNRGKYSGGTNTIGQPSHWNSVWERMPRSTELEGSRLPLQKVFRRHFCIIFSVFKPLVDWWKIWHEVRKYDCTRSPNYPTELKSRGYLRVAGCSFYFDDIEELLFVKMHASSMNSLEKLWQIKFTVCTAAKNMQGACRN